MLAIVNTITLPFIGDINLAGGTLFIFLICLFCVVAFEFVNGFHDTANAVATVIYTKALKPVYAVPWSGFFNFLGVSLGGVAVAMGILKLVPLNELMVLPVQVGACMVLAILVSSILWNLGTWHLGIPCSSSHTLIGAMIGASIAFSYYYGGVGVNWEKAKEIGLSLVLSPLIGFFAAAGLMYFLKNIIKSESLFHIPAGEDKPPVMTRILLITTCTLVSFFHGSNDGQKGVGLLMLILIAFLPAKFAIDHSVTDAKIIDYLTNSEQILQNQSLKAQHDSKVDSATELITKIKLSIGSNGLKDAIKIYNERLDLQLLSKEIRRIREDKQLSISSADKATLFRDAKHLEDVTEYAPIWAIATISISLGIGTMIGWKKIVTTIGEKIGKEHLNYAQGATAEIIAATTIGLSTGLGLPVSTTHVLSSGIAGAMVASNGKKNLNKNTLKNIAFAWVLTVPVSIILAILLFALFNLFI